MPNAIFTQLESTVPESISENKIVNHHVHSSESNTNIDANDGRARIVDLLHLATITSDSDEEYLSVSIKRDREDRMIAPGFIIPEENLIIFS